MKHIIFSIRWPVSGIRNYIKYTFNNETFKEYKFTIVAPDIGFSEFVDKHLDSRFTFVACEGSAKSMIMAILRVCRENPSANINAHGFTAIIYSILPSLICRRKLLGTAHDIFTEKQFSGKFSYLKRVLLALLLNCTKATITVSNDCKENILRYLPLVPSNKLHPILNGIDSQYFAHAQPRPFKKELSLPEETVLVGFLGRFSAQKGFGYIIKAVQTLIEDDSFKSKNFKLVCFGWGGFIREEQEVISKLNLDSYFIFHPFVDDVATAIKGLDLVLMPSLWEACGILAMEVLACGVPLVVSDCEGLREVAMGTPATVVKMRSYEELVQALKKYLGKDSKGAFLEYAEIAQTRYSAKLNTSPQTLLIYKEFLE